MRYSENGSLRDGLTGLPNRVALVQYLESAMPEAEAKGMNIALCIIDIDRMTLINEELGYQAGDEIIRKTAERIGRSIQANDFLARFGGDEFAVVMFYHDFGRVSSTIEGILRQSAEPLTVNGVRRPTSISVGSSVFPECSNGVDDILAMADKAAGRALKAGGNCSIYFDSSMRKAIQKQRWIDERIGAAIDQQHIKPYYQPLIDLRDDSIVGFEVLARWPMSDAGQIFPDEFIEAAERTGEINRMTFMMLEEVIEFAREIGPQYVMAINLSPHQLTDIEIADKITSLIENAGLKVTQFEFEVTENSLISDIKTAASILAKLRARGASIGLDDFGAGYSSLQYIRALPFDKIKIDRAYVNEMLSHDGSTIINAVLSLSNALGFTATAEGIENIETVDMLKALGCGRGQGWYYAKAMPPIETKAFIKTYEAKLRENKPVAKPTVVQLDMNNLPDMPAEFLEYV
jgi:diguanylate cyclase (GGDEF)-like protein